MKHTYYLGGLWRQAWLLVLLALLAPRAWAQTATTIYYTQGSSTATLDALASVGATGGTGTALAAGASNFSQPTDLVLDRANGYLYVADQYVGTGGIYRYNTNGTGRTLVVGGLAGTTYNGLAFDATNNKLYFTQAGAAAANAALKVVSLGGALPATATSVVTLPATFTRPGDVVFDATAGANALYVADQHTSGSIIKVLLSSGAITTPVAGTANATYNGLALDAANGRLYFTQGSTTATLDALKLLTLSTSAVTTLASGSANFSQPSDLAFEPGPTGGAGQLYLTDQYVATGPLLRYTLSVSGGVVSAGTRTTLVAATAGATYGGLALALVNPTAAPVVTTPANGSLLNTRTPTYSGTAVVGSTVTVFVDGTSIGTTTATGGNFSLAQPANLADGRHTVYATAQASGSTVSANSNTNTFTIDATQPTVAISSTASNPTSTSPIPFTVTFSEAVTGFVAGDVTVTNGTIGAVSGSGTTYTFSVTPTANGAVTVNVPANVAQDAAGNGNTAATQFNITYAQPVTVTPVVTTPASGSLLNTTTPSYTGTAPATSTVTVYVDGSAIGTTTANAAGSFTLAQPTALAQGSHTVRATAQLSGSAVSANSNTNTFTVDSVQPTVAISSTATSPTSTSPIPVTVTFSEAVTGFVAGDVTVTNGTLSGLAGSGMIYTFNVTPTAVGTVTVNVPANVAQDAAGNGNTSSAPYQITFAPPTITIAPATLPNGTVAAAYNQALTAAGGTAPYSFAITAGALPAGLTLTSAGVLAGTPTAGGSFTFTVTATDASAAPGPYSGSLAYAFTVAAPTITVAPATLPNGTVASAYSQALTAAGGTAPYSFAVTAGALPSGLSLSANGVLTGTPTASGTFNFTVRATDASTGSGPYNGARAYTLVVGAQPVTATPVLNTPANGLSNNNRPIFSGTALANSTITLYLNGNPTAFPADASGNFAAQFASPLPDGSYTAYVTAQSNGAAVSANSNTATFTIDTAAPSVAISSTASNPTSTSPIPFTVTFSEAVTGFVAGDVTLTNGTIGAVSGSGTTYTFTVTPTANGAVTVNVPANVAQDAAGNGNTAAASTYTITYSQLVTAAPVVTTPANGGLLATTSPTYSGTAPAGSTVRVYVDGTSIGTTTATGGSFSLTQPTALSQGSHTVYATAQTSGSAVSANSATNNFTVDTTAPTVVIGSTATSPTSTSPIPVRVTFSESVIGFVASGVTVTNGTLSGFSGSGSIYTFNVTPTSDGTVTVSVPANAAQDAAGNGNVAATFSIRYAALITATTWNGNSSSDWFNASNWTPNQVPNVTIDAIIPTSPSGNRFPVIGANAAQANARNVSIATSASLSMSANTLTIAANLTNNGAFNGSAGSGSTATGGTVVLGTSTLASILGSSNTRFWNLTVDANGAQSSTSASTSVQRILTLTGSFATQGNGFTVESSSTGDGLVVNNGGVVVGAATVQRYIDPSLNPGLGARHYSAPVSNTTVADLATNGFTPLLNPAFNTSDKPAQVRPFPTVFGYDQSRLTLVNTLPIFDKGFFSPTSFSDPLRVGQGYVVNIASTELVDFVGTLNNGDVTTTMASNRDTYANDGGWQFVGNPYPAPLDYSTVPAADRAGLDASHYVYSSTSQYNGQYRAYVRGIGGNPVVSSGQGFFVRVSSGQPTGSLTLRNANRLTTPSATTFQRTAAETRPLVQLTLKGAGSVSDDAYVYFENGATNGFDSQYDAVKMPNTTGLNLSTSISGQQLAIDGRAELGKTQQVVPLAVGVPTVGTYTFTTAQLLNLANVPVYLRDLQLGTVTDLRLTPSYQFTVTNAAALITGRFELVFSPQQALATMPAALAQQVALYPNPATKAAFVELPASLGRQAVTATLIDALGRQVRTVQLPAQGSVAHSLDLSDLATGVYALRLSTSAGVVVKKLVVE